MFYKKVELLKICNDLKYGRIDLCVYIEEVCKRIDELEPHIHALVPEENRKQRLVEEAQILLKKYPDQNNRPPLFGVLIGIKDIFRVDGFDTLCGSKLPASCFEGQEAKIVTLLKNAGALILGKTVTTEFAYFQAGNTQNPSNTEHTPGGSSSGSAAVVAAGITPLAFGTQTIGSITRPASFCGIIGVKPTYNSLPSSGVIPFSNTFDHLGYFTHDIEGAELIASLFCNEWDKNILNTSRPVIGISSENYLKQANEDVMSNFYTHIEKIKEFGFDIIQTSLFDNIETINKYHKLLAAKEFADTHALWFQKYGDLYSFHSKELLIEGLKVKHEQIKDALSLKNETSKQLEDLMQENGINVWLSPSTVSLAPKGLSSTGSPLMNLPWTFTGVPTISIPSGLSENHLHYGLQLSGKFNDLKNLFAQTKKIKNIID